MTSGSANKNLNKKSYRNVSDYYNDNNKYNADSNNYTTNNTCNNN